MKYLPGELAFAKLITMVAGAQIVRTELEMASGSPPNHQVIGQS